MPLQIIRNDITKLEVDAIVTSANKFLRGGGGVDGCIHRAAGPELLAECKTLHGCRKGSAKITKGYRLPCKYVIHAVGPRWHGGRHHEKALLESCYRAALELAKEYNCQSIAFPLISSGIYGYPKEQAFKVAVDTIRAFLLKNEMMVYLVTFDSRSYQIGEKWFDDIASYIDDHYVEAHIDPRSEQRRYLDEQEYNEAEYDDAESNEEESQILRSSSSIWNTEDEKNSRQYSSSSIKRAAHSKGKTLEEALEQIDESFSQMLLRKIDERGMTDAQCYKKANVDRKLFSKIRSDKFYRPSKSTVLAFALALELPLPEMQDMLQKAGFVLSHSSKFDIIVEYFVEKGNYDVYEINEALLAFDQSLIG